MAFLATKKLLKQDVLPEWEQKDEWYKAIQNKTLGRLALASKCPGYWVESDDSDKVTG
jgi:hypothetical protein